MKVKIKRAPDKQKLRKYGTNISSLQEMLKGSPLI